jgi:hypothetical protein
MKKGIILLAGFFFAAGIQFQPSLQAGVLSIPAAALLPKDNDISYDTNGVRMAVLDNATTEVFQAPASLPHNAIIERITLDGKDASGSGFIQISLREYRFNTFLVLKTFGTTAGEAPGDIRRGRNVTHLINNRRFSYGVEVSINNGGNANDVWYYRVEIRYMDP